jgi:hypothetical protein
MKTKKIKMIFQSDIEMAEKYSHKGFKRNSNHGFGARLLIK